MPNYIGISDKQEIIVQYKYVLDIAWHTLFSILKKKKNCPEFYLTTLPLGHTHSVCRHFFVVTTGSHYSI